MNWGNKILIGFSAFVVGIGTMVYIAMKQTNEMVDSNYYEKELLYQAKIDASKNLVALNEKLKVMDSAGFIMVKFPAASINNNPVGHIECLRSSEQKRDVNVSLVVDTSGIQLLQKSMFINGVYQLRIDWINNGIKYFHEQTLTIKK
jgi:hypothetical protein